MQAAAFLWKHCIWVTDAARACCWSLLEFQDDRCWRACLKWSGTVYKCIQAVRLWQIKSVFTAAEIISKSEKDAWSRQIHSVTCTRSNTTPSWRYQYYWAGGDRKQKIKSLWKSVLSSRLCVNMRVCKSSMFMHSLIHGCVCVWWEEVCREAVRGVVINRCLQSSAGGFSYRDETEENRFVTASLVGRNPPTADALL